MSPKPPTSSSDSCARPAHPWAAASPSSTRAAKATPFFPSSPISTRSDRPAQRRAIAKGLSTCCHGEEPHVVGWRFIADRRAISLDANCGWTRGKADVVYVADAFQVVAKLNELLAAKKA